MNSLSRSGVESSTFFPHVPSKGHKKCDNLLSLPLREINPISPDEQLKLRYKNSLFKSLLNLFVCRHSVCHSIPAIVHLISATVVRKENMTL